MRPLIKPAVRRLWRDRQTLQLGLDPQRAVVLTNLDAATVTLLNLLDGRHTTEHLHQVAAEHGMSAQAVADLLELLDSAALLIDCQPAQLLPAALPSTERQRLAPDLAALSLHHHNAGEVLARRNRRRVIVAARGRLGPLIAAILAAAGVGSVAVRGIGTTHRADSCPGGIAPTDDGRSYAHAAGDAIRRSAPLARTVIGRAHRADLIVLAGGGQAPSYPERHLPHLAVALRDTIAVVGPLVVPGHTACFSCLELHRRDRDPAWPVLAAQLATSRAQPPEAAAIVTAAAGIAAAQSLCFLDGRPPEVLSAAVELSDDGATMRRRSWSPHPDCRCRAALHRNSRTRRIRASSTRQNGEGV